MKKSIITIVSLFVSTGLMSSDIAPNASELSWVDEQVEAIKPARIGAKNSYLGRVHNPFIFLHNGKVKKATGAYVSSSKAKRSITQSTKTTSSKKGKLALEAIINKSALIDGKWYKEGQTIYGYKLEQVSAKSVLLKKSTKTVVLTTKTKRKSLKFNNN